MRKATFEYDLPDDENELKLAFYAGELFSALCDIHSMVRNELKHGDEELSDHIERLLEMIKEEASIINNIGVI